MLDPEYFLGLLESATLSEELLARSGHENARENIKVGDSPLFLTVLCYVYATEVLKQGSHEIGLSLDFTELITVCIDLLISDLDENKARDLPPVRRAALVKRRGAYAEEKKLFLRYFAFVVSIEQISTFDLRFIKERVKYFFTECDRGHNGALIVAELERDISTNPHFALQLIYCGVFSTLAINDAGTSYDFAHRRFREVLAVQFIDTPQRYCELLAKRNAVGLAELVKVFRKSKKWYDLAFHENTLRHILDRCMDDRSGRYVVISDGFVSEMPIGLKASDIILTFLDCALRVAKPYFMLSVRILLLVYPIESLLGSARVAFEQACTMRDTRRAVFAFRAVHPMLSPYRTI